MSKYGNKPSKPTIQLNLKAGSNWKQTPIHHAQELQKEEAWAGMPKQAISYIKSLPEYDQNIFEEITGIKS